MKKFAMLGKWHVHAPGYAKELNSLPGCQVAAVWDPDQAIAEKWAAELGCAARTLDEILADPDIEGVAICCATNEHPDLLLRACAAGKAVFTEKVLTLREADAQAVRQAVLRHHTRFAISFPHLSEPAVRFALEKAQSGALGTLNFVRVRKAHNGATAGWLPPHFYDPIACGGGAMIDLGAHPVYLACALLGEPLRAHAAFTQATGKGGEDNAVGVLEFAGGALGVAETSFVSSAYPFLLEAGGDRGTLLLQGGKVSYCCQETGDAWQEAALPQALPSPLAQWALAARPEEIPAGFGIDAAVRLTRAMEMLYAAQ